MVLLSIQNTVPACMCGNLNLYEEHSRISYETGFPKQKKIPNFFLHTLFFGRVLISPPARFYFEINNRGP